MTWPLTFLVVLFALIFLMQFLTERRAVRTEGHTAPDTSAVDGNAHADPRRLYYFYTPHCGPCKAMTPLVDRLRATHRNLIKINIAEAPEIAHGFSIAATPSFVLVEAEVIRRVELGGQSERKLLGLLRGEAQ